MPACKLDLDPAFGCIAPGRIMTGMIDNLYRQETGTLRRRLPRPRSKPWITQPLEDQIGIQPIAPRDLRNRYIRRRRLKTDRPLLVVRPKPPRSTHHPQPHNLIDFRLLRGQTHDLRGTAALIEGLKCGQLLADRAFDAN